jgi:hypothetical protein
MVSVTEPSDAVKARMATQTEGGRLALLLKSLPLDLLSVGRSVGPLRLFSLLAPPMKVERTGRSETLAHKIRTAGNQPKERMQ